jgi:hypothetical protein
MHIIKDKGLKRNKKKIKTEMLEINKIKDY